MRTALKRIPRLGFTLTEALVAMAVGGIMVVSLYSGMTSASYSMRLAREDLRATQVLLDKLETIRLCTWNQVNDGSFMPKTFTEPIYPEQANGPVLAGTIAIDNPKLKTKYNDEIRMVTVTVTWGGTGELKRSRQMSTYAARYGITRYLLQKE